MQQSRSFSTETFSKRNKLTINDFKGIKDLEKLPIITKKELISNSKKLYFR